MKPRLYTRIPPACNDSQEPRLARGAAAVIECSITAMKLITAHRILIASAAIFFLFFALWELRNYSNGGDPWAAARSALYFLVSLGFGIYLKNFHRWYKLK